MNCPNCGKEVSPDRVFCTWCDMFIPDPSVGRRAGLVRRWFANLIDPAIAILLWFIIAWILTAVISIPSSATNQAVESTEIGVAITIIIYLILFIWWIRRGLTPGKWLLRIRVVNKLNGQIPGFWRMVFREIIGKFVSGFFLGLGFFWAIWAD